jgi:hypothetical protein
MGGGTSASAFLPHAAAPARLLTVFPLATSRVCAVHEPAQQAGQAAAHDWKALVPQMLVASAQELSGCVVLRFHAAGAEA